MFNRIKKKFKQQKSKAVRQEEKRQQALVKEHFYPWLLKNSESVKDAKNKLLLFSTALQSKFDTETLKKREELSKGTLNEMGLDTLILDKDAPEMELLTILGNEKVSTAKALVDGMMNAIDGSVQGELKDRKLETLPVHEQFAD